MLPQYSGILEMHTKYRLSKLKKHQSGISPQFDALSFQTKCVSEPLILSEDTAHTFSTNHSKVDHRKEMEF